MFLLKNYLFIAACLWLYGCSGGAVSSPETVISNALPDHSSALDPSERRYYEKRVSGFVDSLFSRSRFNGCVLVAKDGEIIYEKYAGFWDPAHKKDSISAATPFHLASVSKTFTAMAVLKLQEEGKLHTDDPVSNYLSGFPLDQVTIKTLLNHRSGIPNYIHYMDQLGWDRSRHVSNQDVLDFIIARRKDIQIGPADRRFAYSNTNYALLALVIEKVSGHPFPEFMRLNFFEPLGMNDTYVFTMADSARSLPSYFYSGKQYAFDYFDLVYGDKNIYSTARDLLKWDQALYSGLFREQTIREAFAGYSFEKPGINNYGLGWRMFNLRNGRKFVYHNGWWHGNRTAFYRLPEERVAIIAFSNNDVKRVYSCKSIADIFGNYFTDPKDEKEANKATTQKTTETVISPGS